MSCGAARLIGLLLLLALCGGCATTKYEGAFDPALFPRAAVAPAAPAAPDIRAPGRVAIVVRAALRDQVHESKGGMANGLRLPAGRIVEEALVATVSDAWRGGAHRMDEAPAAGAGFAATLVLEAVRVAHTDKLSWLMPLPFYPFIIGDRDAFSHLAFDLSLIDAEGRTVWTRTYDGGAELLKRPSFWSNELVVVGMTRMAHETAWRLSQQVVTDLRDWLAGERNKPREL